MSTALESPKVSWKLSLRESGVIYRTAGKVSSLFLKSFLLVSTKLSFLQADWALGYHSMAYGQFPDIS